MPSGGDLKRFSQPLHLSPENLSAFFWSLFLMFILTNVFIWPLWFLVVACGILTLCYGV